MRRILLTIAIIFIAYTGYAQKTIANLRTVAPTQFLDCEIKSFADNDSILYMAFRTYKLKDGEFYFMFVTPEVADTISRCALNKSIKFKDRRQWMQAYMDSTDWRDLDRSKSWTKYTPRKIYQRNGYSTKEPFGFAPAWRAYTKQHNLNLDGTKKKEPTVEEWITFLKAVRMVGAMMPQGETRPLVDQIRNLP